MKINSKKDKSIHIVGNDFEYIKAVRRPNVNTKIVYEVWFGGTIKTAMEVLNRKSIINK